VVSGVLVVVSGVLVVVSGTVVGGIEKIDVVVVEIVEVVVGRTAVM
jgi:hypothetical protein